MPCAPLPLTPFVDDLAAITGVSRPDMGVPDSGAGPRQRRRCSRRIWSIRTGGNWFARQFELPGIFVVGIVLLTTKHE